MKSAISLGHFSVAGHPLPYTKIKQLLNVVSRIHLSPPWQNPTDFFGVLRRVIDFDYSITFLQLDRSTYKVIPTSHTVSGGCGNDRAIIQDYNNYFWKFKKPLLTHIVKHPEIALDLTNGSSWLLSKNQMDEFKFDFWTKYKIGRCYARYMKTQDGLVGIYVSRPPGSKDFSGHEKTCLDLLAPHLKAVLHQDHSKTNCFFSDAQGKIVSADKPSEALLENPMLATQLRYLLPIWLRSVMSDPIKPFCAKIQEKGARYQFAVIPFGLGNDSLFRISWDQSQQCPQIEVVQRFIQSYALSPRQQDMLSGLLSGKQVKEIAKDFNLARDTVKEYFGSLYKKVCVDGRGPLIAKVLSKV